MKKLIQKILNFESLNYEESKTVIEHIVSSNYNDFELVALITGIEMKGISLTEINGFQDALLEHAQQVDLSTYEGIDLCGTGGDGKNTFNISTCSSLVLASMGFKVIKHGNYGVSSICGSSNVLEFLGFNFPKNQDELEREIENKNIAILHAPFFHPTLKKVGNIRKELGIRTFFNCLGPLINPAKPKYQMTGTYSLELAKIYQYLLKNRLENYKIVHGLDGYDELTLTCPTKIFSKQEELIYTNQTFNSSSKITNSDILGGESIKDAASILVNIISGKGSEAQNSVIAANVSSAIHCIDPTSDLKENYLQVKEHLLAGKTSKFFKINAL
jgi:anthranilate phosphoribosyltransferase